MAEQIYSESNYRFTDPIRFFKANDPYYFEVDNIPLKQLQENCLWLKDQLQKGVNSLTKVKRADIEELRPYATGSDRLVRVKPGRYTARINDASTRTPLAYIRKILGEAVGDPDIWGAATPQPGGLPGNALLEAALERFKEAVSEDALGMNGLVERAFTWPIVDIDRPINNDGVEIDPSKSWLSYGDDSLNQVGERVINSPFLITEAILWAKTTEPNLDEVTLTSYDSTFTNSGWSTFPLTESYFIKAWRGVARTSIVDIDEELSIEIPQFDATDFSYTDSDGNTVAVDNVQQRVDLVFIYSKPVDTSAVDIIRGGAVERISKPALGVVKGAGIKANFESKDSNTVGGYKDPTNDSILASPGDQYNLDMGFTATSANDIAASVRGSFPSPDDLLNIAPLISQKLEDNAYELLGQSILPVAYVFVQGASQVVLTTDVVDIRPLFRTAELTYNERAGIAAAYPQLSLANPAIGKSQLDFEMKRMNDVIDQRILDNRLELEARNSISTVGVGYVFGGYEFGPEGAMFDARRKAIGAGNSLTLDSTETRAIKDFVEERQGYTYAGISIPDRPQWNTARWTGFLPYVGFSPDSSIGDYPNDYITTVVTGRREGAEDDAILGGSNAGLVRDTDADSVDGRCKTFNNMVVSNGTTQVYFHYVSKKIFFNRPDWMADYTVDVQLINCIPQSSVGVNRVGATDQNGSYFGTWVEKGADYFIIYVAFTADSDRTPGVPKFPAPHTRSGNITVSERGGERFSGFLALTEQFTAGNENPIRDNMNNQEIGYNGNPRLGKCTLPSVMYKITAIPYERQDFLYSEGGGGFFSRLNLLGGN